MPNTNKITIQQINNPDMQFIQYLETMNQNNYKSLYMLLMQLNIIYRKNRI